MAIAVITMMFVVYNAIRGVFFLCLYFICARVCLGYLYAYSFNLFTYVSVRLLVCLFIQHSREFVIYICFSFWVFFIVLFPFPLSLLQIIVLFHLPHFPFSFCLFHTFFRHFIFQNPLFSISSYFFSFSFSFFSPFSSSFFITLTL